MTAACGVANIELSHRMLNRTNEKSVTQWTVNKSTVGLMTQRKVTLVTDRWNVVCEMLAVCCPVAN